ncbi:MAG: type II secretion system F family protein, partial [Solirubrobacteraceae bacterium]|nr:type II secretion system F family protein [Solirubrobacteraceae bacterium]
QAIDAALARRPPLDPGTRLLDAARTSLGVLGKADVQAGAIVVLSDGSDRGSRTSAAQIARLAERDSVRVYTVGARSRSYEAATLQDLARATGGRYLGAASGPALVRLYRALGSELANSYVLRWRSQMPAGDRVRVVADAGGILARSSYVAPPVALATSGRPRAESFFATNAGIAVVAVSALLAVLLLFWALMGGRGGGHGVRERVADYGPEPLPALEGGPERGKAQSGRWAAFAELLDIGGIEASPGRIVLLTLAGGAAAALAVGVVTGSAVVAVLMLPVAALVAWALVRRAVTRRREAFAGQLADSLQAVASAMRAGHSFAGGLAVLCEEAPEPAASEFTRVIADERLGVPLEDAFESLRRRMDNRDVEQVALVAVLQRETGGNGAEALDRVVENLRGREDVRRLVKTLTAQGQLSRWVLTAIPAALLGLLALIAGDYVAPLFETTAGHVLLVLAGLLCVAGSLLIDRIVKIEV